nr:uncharacterized protein LOC115258830 [Aedes albopictus]XP_029721822.1 uncharacterized protein LOC115263027 [Aedes albopictus]
MAERVPAQTQQAGPLETARPVSGQVFVDHRLRYAAASDRDGSGSGPSLGRDLQPAVGRSVPAFALPVAVGGIVGGTVQYSVCDRTCRVLGNQPPGAGTLVDLRLSM